MHRSAPRLGFLALASLAFAFAGCSGAAESVPASSPPPPLPAAELPRADAASDAGTDGAVAPAVLSTYFPSADGTWETIDPATAGFDPAKLTELTDWVGQKASTTFVILFDGRIVTERYWGGATSTTTRDVASAQKSVTSLLVGAAIAQGAFGLDDTVTSALGDGWSNGTVADETGITVRHLLTMTSGLDGNLEHDASPGAEWLYNTDAYHRLELVLQTKTGKSLQDFTRSVLFDPIGAGPSVWAKRQLMKDAKGVPVSALEMTARDMARVGLLVMAGGTWDGKSVVPSTYLSTALASSQELNPSYGFLFWLNGQSRYLLPPRSPHDGMLMPHAPADLVAALGANDQKIYVSRSARLVVTRQGGKAADGALASSDWDDELWTRIMAARTAK